MIWMIYHDLLIDDLSRLDNLDPNLALWDVVQGLFWRGPSRETCGTAAVDHADRTAPARKQEPDQSDQRCVFALKGLDHEMGMIYPICTMLW